jgi:hypothetical protein
VAQTALERSSVSVEIIFGNADKNYLSAMQYAVLENRCGVISSSVEGDCDRVPAVSFASFF